MVDITYGILNYNPANNETAIVAYAEAIESLAVNRNPKFKSEVYLIDQASQPSLTESLARKYKFNAILLNRNVGISRGINILINASRGSYVSLVTSDTVFTNNLDTILIAQLNKNPELMQICPKSNMSSIKEQVHTPKESFGQYNVTMSDNGYIDCMSQELTIQFWPRSTFNKIGYFDERWKACYENLDFALRIGLSGGRVGISQEAFCWHHHNMTTKNCSISNAYDGYLHMPEGIDHSVLSRMFDKKWPGLRNKVYSRAEDLSTETKSCYMNKIYMPYIQDVNYEAI
jgi:GT2 family glycosyltransferase